MVFFINERKSGSDRLSTAPSEEKMESVKTIIEEDNSVSLTIEHVVEFA